MSVNTHWTARSIVDFVYRISSDFVLQIEAKMDREGMNQSKLAEALSVTDGRVSQVLRNPGNLTLKKMVEYAKSVGMKVSVVAYEDNDPENNRGPINSEIFSLCWERFGKPRDFRLFDNPRQIVVPCLSNIKYIKILEINHEEISGQSILHEPFDIAQKGNNKGTVITAGVN